jgi:hypothetical protein
LLAGAALVVKAMTFSAARATFVTMKQDAVLERLMPALDLALGHG